MQPATRPAAEALTRPLGQPIRFDSTPFDEMVEYLRSTSGTPFYVNYAALELEGIDRTVKINLDVPATVTLGKTLDLTLEQLGQGFAELVAYADGPIVVVTTADQRAAELGGETVLYDLRPLIKAAGDKEGMSKLIQLIRDTVRSDVWRDNGGTVATLNEIGGVIAVNAPPEMHAEIRALIDDLNETFGVE